MDGGHRGAFASPANRERALLVLKQVPVLEDSSLEGFTDFQGDMVAQDDPRVVFEASGKSVSFWAPTLPPTPGQPSSAFSHPYLLPTGPGTVSPT